MSTFAPKFSLSGFKMPDRVFSHQGPAAHRPSVTSISVDRNQTVKAKDSVKWTKFGVDLGPKPCTNGVPKKMVQADFSYTEKKDKI